MAKANKKAAETKKKPTVNRGKTVRKSVGVPETKPFFIVCVGASAGGFSAIIDMASQLSPSLNAAVFIVLHLSKTALGDVFVERVKKDSKLPCKLAEMDDVIKPGHIYFAQPNTHLLVKKGKVVLGYGPAENRFRPSIDVLFRSAAASYGEHVIGVVLTGLLNDGTVGMVAIRESGGYCIVQDPNEAEYPDMPVSVLQNVEVDHVIPLNQLSETLQDIIQNHKLKGSKPPPMIIAESNLSEKAATGIEKVSTLGESSVFACPDCGGGLWNVMNGKVAHYRCHIGHSYTESDLLIKQAEAIEHTLWVAVRMMEERKINFRKLEKESRDRGLTRLADSNGENALQLEGHITRLKDLLFSVQKD